MYGIYVTGQKLDKYTAGNTLFNVLKEQMAEE